MILAMKSDLKKESPVSGRQTVFAKPSMSFWARRRRAKNLIYPNTYTFKILRLPPQNDTAKQSQQWLKTPGRKYVINQFWYGYCLEIRILKRQKNYYFRIYMLFSLDITRSCIVNVPEVILHPYQDPSFETKGGGAGIATFFISMGHMLRNENKSSRQGG